MRLPLPQPVAQMRQPDPISEVIETATTEFLAQCLHATTSPIDSVHRARALSLSIEDLHQQQPQILLNRTWLVNAGRTLSVFLKNDDDRLRILLSQVYA